MRNFKIHYENFLGINDKNSENLISCNQRDKIFCFNYNQILIVSNLNDKLYYSISPKYYSKFQKDFNLDKNIDNFDNIFFDVDDYFVNILEKYQITKYYRLSNPNIVDTNLKCFYKIEVLSDNNKKLYFKLIGERGQKFKETRWINRQKLIEEKRYFIIVENDEIAAYSFISDIDYEGANIGVVTIPKYRRKGYGKALVSKAIEWCNKNEVIPIYLVNQQNDASVKLAKSLGFKVMSKEIIVTI